MRLPRPDLEDEIGRPWWRVVIPPFLVVLLGTFMISYGDTGLRRPAEAQLVLVILGAGALLFRLRHPPAVTVVTVLAGAALPMFAPHVVLVDVASCIALYTLATRAERRTVGTAAAVAIALLTLSSALWRPGHLADLRNVLPANYVIIAVAVGDAVRSRRIVLQQANERARLAEQTREDEARRRVHEERVRIARDLHDVVAHHITLVNAQAGVAHHLLQSHPEQAYQALADIRETSRSALDELRATVGLLRQDDDPPESLYSVPRFEFLDDLLDSFRTTGFTITVTTSGTSCPLSGPADLAAYRIVQEALTNATKHGTQPSADLDLAYTDTSLQLTITNPARAGRQGSGTGHGLIGMRERAEASGGIFAATLTATSTFVVQATLPLQA
jgi:signal transduction histidine kinase